MEKNKVTKAQRFEQIKTILVKIDTDADFHIDADADVDIDSLVEFIDHELDLLAKKSANKKPAKKSEEFLALKEIVADTLTDEPKTISEIIHSTDALTGITTQKVVPILKELVNECRATRLEEKGKALFVKTNDED